MKLDDLILIGLFLLCVPLLGTVFAMALGVVINVSRGRDMSPLGGSAPLVLDDLERLLQSAAAFFGSSVEGARNVVDRRAAQRRMRARRLQMRTEADRRLDDRRLWDRRQQFSR